MAARRRRRIIWLIIPCVLLTVTIAGVGWYCWPYIEGDMEYSALREYAPLPDDAIQEAPEGAVQEAQAAEVATETGDPNMNRQIDWAGLSAINPDIIGWIYIPNTNVDYPVVQASPDDPNKYLHTTFEGRVRYPNNEGCIFVDASAYGEGFSYIAPTLYGHWQNNKSMFTNLSPNYHLETLLNQDEIYIYTPTGTIHLKAFAANLVNADTERIRTEFNGVVDLRSWIVEKMGDSEAVSYDPGNIPQLFTLCVCNFSGTYAHARTLTYAQVVEDTRPEAVKTDSVAFGDVVQAEDPAPVDSASGTADAQDGADTGDGTLGAAAEGTEVQQ